MPVFNERYFQNPRLITNRHIQKVTRKAELPKMGDAKQQKGSGDHFFQLLRYLLIDLKTGDQFLVFNPHLQIQEVTKDVPRP